MINTIRSVHSLVPIARRLPEKLSYILIVTLFAVGLVVAALSWRVASLSHTNTELRLQETRFLERLAVQPTGTTLQRVSLLPALSVFDAFENVAVDTQRFFHDARVTVRDATHTPLPGDADSDIRKVEITVHARGEYLAIKKAIAALLDQHEELALKSLTISREQSIDGAPQVEARFTFFHRKQR